MPDDDDSSRALHELEQLTVQAVIAAENGDWDKVDFCITRRGLLFGQATIPSSLVVRLRALDRRIEASMLIARDAVTSAMAEIGRVRNNMARLQQGADAYHTTQSSIVNINA